MCNLINVTFFGECIIVDDVVSIFSVVQWIFVHGLTTIEMNSGQHVRQILNYGHFGQLLIVFLLLGPQIVCEMLSVALVPMYLRIGAHIHQHRFLWRQCFRARDEFQCETSLQVVGSCGRRMKWYANEGHRRMGDVYDLLVQRLHKIIVDGDSGVDAQKWKSEIVASGVDDGREGGMCTVNEFGTGFGELFHILLQRDIRWDHGLSFGQFFGRLIWSFVLAGGHTRGRRCNRKYQIHCTWTTADDQDTFICAQMKL